MEYILYTLIVVSCIAVVVSIARLIRFYRAGQRAEIERQRALKKRIVQVTKEVDALAKRVRVSTPTKKASTPPRGKETTQTYTQSTSNDDGFFDGVVAGMVANTLIDSFTNSSERSVGVSKTESSWGFDDPDSRKSISDSMNTSSSSDFGGSDSGPSSDW